MLMIIFGAGASYDSVPSKPPTAYGRDIPGYETRPPLADDLFHSSLLNVGNIWQFPQCLDIVPWLQTPATGKSVEGTLEGLREEAHDYPARNRQLAAIRYYLHYMFLECTSAWKTNVVRGISNFRTLFDLVQRWRKDDDPVCLVTFNYDTLIEDALSPFGVAIKDIQNYTDNPLFKLIKLHGSANWGRVVVTPLPDPDADALHTASWLIDNASQLDVTDQYLLLKHHLIAKVEQRGVLPAIAIPVETKKNYECPRQHLEELDSILPYVDKLLIIGWRGAEEHFLTMLRKKLKPDIRTFIVAGSEQAANEVIAKLRSSNIRGDFSAGKGGFTDFILSREGDRFFSS